MSSSTLPFVRALARDDCQCMVVAIYESKAHAEAASQAVQAMSADYAHMLAAPPEAPEYEVILHVA